MGARLDDLRRARVSQHRRDAGRRRGDRGAGPRAGKAGVRARRTLHRETLGHDDMSPERLRSMLRAAVTLVVAGAIYEAVARTEYFPAVLMPPLSTIGAT